WMVSEFDAGPIAYQAAFPVADSDSPLTLFEESTRHGSELIRQLLRQAASEPERIPRQAQDLNRREYFGKAIPNGGRLRWDRPAGEVLRFVRACDYGPFPSPWGRPVAALNGGEVSILAAEATGELCRERPGTTRASPRGLEVATADEWILVTNTA
ncbi:MAG: hypothetical protein GY953_37130, partial [bacterium]|nr:hypothetical protein [bacterium]